MTVRARKRRMVSTSRSIAWATLVSGPVAMSVSSPGKRRIVVQQESRRVAADGPVGRGEAVGHAAQAVTAVDLAGGEPGTDKRRSGARHHGDGRSACDIEHATGVGGGLEEGDVAAHRADALHGELGRAERQ